MENFMKELLSKRLVFIGIGIFNIALFHYAILRLWFFLLNSSGRLEVQSPILALVINTALLVFFSAPHSFLLNSKVKVKFLQYMPNTLYGTFYSLHACLGIVLMDNYWVTMGPNLLNLNQISEGVIIALYTFNWLFMFWSMLATGLFRQSGIEEWWKGLKGEKIKYTLLSNGPYRVCRHPIYASFIGMIWFTPNVSIDRLYLSLFWTAYILLGASLKERRLRRNKKYQSYSQEVPAFPFMPRSWDNFLTYKIWGQPR